MKSIRTALLLMAAALAFPSLAAEKAARPTSPSWEKLKSLVGEWTGQTTTVSYRLVSSGAALMETIDSADHMQMITMYHPDGDSLLMTHYCSMGNQPRMRSKGLEGGKLDFQYVDAANVKGPEDPRMSRLVINFVDADHIVSEWTYREGAKETAEKFALTRKK